MDIAPYGEATKEGFSFFRTILNKIWADKNVKIESARDIELAAAQIEQAFNEQGLEISKLGATNVRAEIESEDWVSRRWRPVLMWVCIYTIFIGIPVPMTWNYLLLPIINPILLTQGFQMMPIPINIDLIPDAVWSLMTVGIGGYTLVRSLVDKKETEITTRKRLDLEQSRIEKGISVV